MYYIYFIHQYGDKFSVKIGMTKDLNKRLHDLQTGNPAELKYYRYFNISEDKKICEQLEKLLHLKCKDKKIRGEWFYLSSDELENLCIHIEEWLSKERKFMEI